MPRIFAWTPYKIIFICLAVFLATGVFAGRAPDRSIYPDQFPTDSHNAAQSESHDFALSEQELTGSHDAGTTVTWTNQMECPLPTAIPTRQPTATPEQCC